MFNDVVLDQIDLSNIKLISCDIFDTLLLRKFIEPNDVFEKVAEIAIEKKIINKNITPIDFMKLRMEAQRRARNRKKEDFGHREVSLEEIYNEFPESFIKNELIDLELNIEKEFIYLNDKVYKFLNYCKLKEMKVVLLSDMYLSSEQIKGILQNAGADLSIFDEIIVSCEYNKSKHERELFTVLINKYRTINTDEIIHIGDNYQSDYLNPLSFGITSYHYQLEQSKEEKYKLEIVKKDFCIKEIYYLRKRLSFNNKYNTEEENFWYDFGATVLGPVLTNFVEYIISIAREEKIKDIYPIMRDGYIYQKIIELHMKITGEKYNIKPLYTSRLSTYLSTIEKFDEIVLASLIHNSVLTVEGLFNRLKLQEHPFAKYNHETFSSTKSIINKDGQTLYDSIIEFLLSDKIRQQINNNIQLDRKLLVEYIEQTVNTKNKIITIDVGYNGTVNSSIEKALEISGKKLNAIHLLMIGGVSLYKKIFNSIDIRSFINYYKHQDFLKSNFNTSLILDSLLQDEEGSVIGYETLNDNKVVPKLDQFYIESKNIHNRKICQEGILDYYRSYLEFKVRTNLYLPSNISEKSMWIIERFMKYPTRLEAKYLGEIYTENKFNFKDQEKLCPESEEIKAGELGPEKYLLKKRDRISIWPSGIVERVFPYYLSLQLYKESTNNNTMVMSHIAELFINNQIKECIIYGAGEMGSSLLKMLNTCGVKVHCMVDRNEKLWGNMLDGIEIVSFEQSKTLPCNIYAIASHAFVDEIHQFIKENYTEDKEVQIINYLDIYKYVNGVRVE